METFFFFFSQKQANKQKRARELKGVWWFFYSLKRLKIKLLSKIIFKCILSEFGPSVICTVCVTHKCQSTSQQISPVIYLMYGTLCIAKITLPKYVSAGIYSPCYKNSSRWHVVWVYPSGLRWREALPQILIWLFVHLCSPSLNIARVGNIKRLLNVKVFN